MWQVTGRKLTVVFCIHSAKFGVDLSEPDLYPNHGYKCGLFHALCNAQGT